MSSPYFARGPDHIIVELEAQAAAAPTSIHAPTISGAIVPSFSGFVLPHGGGLAFSQLFRIGGSLAQFAHTASPTSFPLRPAPSSGEAIRLSNFLCANLPRGFDKKRIEDTIKDLNSAPYVSHVYYYPAPIRRVVDTR